MPPATLAESTLAAKDPPRPTRAAALPPDERRAAIVQATLPLLLEHGPAVTTRLIAVAAGIAEGTIFRVFPDKESLIAAVVETVYDTQPAEDALAAIDPALPFEKRLALAVEIVQRRLANIWRIASTVGTAPENKRRATELRGIVALFESERDRLAYDPRLAAQMLRGVTLAGSHPALIHDHTMSPEEIVSLLLDGIRAR